jgi:hypothetical protein
MPGVGLGLRFHFGLPVMHTERRLTPYANVTSPCRFCESVFSHDQDPKPPSRAVLHGLKAFMRQSLPWRRMPVIHATSGP